MEDCHLILVKFDGVFTRKFLSECGPHGFIFDFSLLHVIDMCFPI